MKDKQQFPHRENQAVNKDFKTLYDNISRLELVTTNPNGSRVAQFAGETVYLQLGGKHYVSVATTKGSTTWRSVELTLSL
jgi:hypothetical protein